MIMTMKDQVIELHHFGRWARKRLLQSIPSSDTDDAFTRPVSDLGTIRARFVHIMAAELIWIDRIGFDRPARFASAMLPEEDVPDRVALSERWGEIDARYDHLFASCNDEMLNGSVTYRSMGGASFQSTLREILMHVALHGMYHRGQVATILSRLGGPVVSTDLITFYREQRGQQD